MRAKFTALLAMFMVLMFSEEGFAYKLNHYREGQNVRAEALLRNIRLIPIATAQAVAAEAVASRNVSFELVELDSESSDFRPVYKLSVKSDRKRFVVDVDAVTGQVLNVR